MKLALFQESGIVFTSKPTKEVPPHGLLYIGQREMAVVAPDDGKSLQVSIIYQMRQYMRFWNIAYVSREVLDEPVQNAKTRQSSHSLHLRICTLLTYIHSYMYLAGLES